MTFEQLNLQFDMLYLFRRIERNIRQGVTLERVREWTVNTVRAAVPLGLPKSQELRSEMIRHCNDWIDYLVENPVKTSDTGYLRNNRIEQLRLHGAGRRIL